MTTPTVDRDWLVAEYLRLRTAQITEDIALDAPDPLAWRPLPYQRLPEDDDWALWLLMAGRNTGKTDACAAAMNAHAEGPPCLRGRRPHRMRIIAPTLGDAWESCVEGVSGLTAHNPKVVGQTRRGGSFAFWPNGSQARLLGVNSKKDVDRLRASGNSCFDWYEELAAWPYLRSGYDQATLSRRIARRYAHVGADLTGRRVHAVASTTPRTRPLIAELKKEGSKQARIRLVTGISADDNPFADPEYVAQLHKLYDGTRLGRQEMMGELLEAVEGALWTQDLLDEHRVLDPDDLPRLVMAVVAVDPSWGTTGDECGIVVIARGSDQHAYVLADLSGRMTPSEWGELAGLALLNDPERLTTSDGHRRVSVPHFPGRLDRVLGEKNFQGEQVRLVMRSTATALKATLPFKLVPASLGKRLRAEPVVALYEQGRVHHVGTKLAGLEEQMTTWVPPQEREESDGGAARSERVADRAAADRRRADDADDDRDQPSESPDRVDALVFGVTDLLLLSGGPTTIELATGRIPGRGRPGALEGLPPHMQRAARAALRRG